MSVAQKLLTLIITALSALLLMALAGFWQARQLDHSLEFISTESMPSVIALEEIQGKFWQMRTTVWQHVAYRQPNQKQDAEDRFDKLLAEVDAQVDQYDKRWGNDAAEQAAIAEIRKALQEYREYCRGLFLISKNADTEQTYFELMASINSSGKTVASAVIKALSDHIQLDKDAAAASVSQSRKLQQRMQLFCGILLVSIFALLGVLGLTLYRGIIGPLHSARDTLNHVENRLDFTVRAQVIRNDEIGQMMNALNSLLARMQGNLRDIANGAGRVADSAMALVSNAQQVSQGSARQSEVAADMATSMEEMAVSIGHVADRASETSQLSRQAGEQAHDGVAMIGQTQQDISEISRVSLLAEDEIAKLDTQTTRINEVVTIIREVAEQTNLLALNAAIEAARAGESGRGFAVVADEIRKLAERTATSTQQIAGTVSEIRDTATRARAGMGETVTLVSDSVTRASEASAAITLIGNGAQQTRTMISEISDSIHEQRAASENVAGKVEVIAQMAEENSAAAANTAESARHLDELAHEMRQIVLQYRV